MANAPQRFFRSGKGFGGTTSRESFSSTVDGYYRSGTHLWRSVIHRAIEEADGERLVVLEWQNKRGLSVEGRRELRESHTGRIQRAARRYLTNDTIYLRRVHELAQLREIESYEEFLARMRGRYPTKRVN